MPYKIVCSTPQAAYLLDRLQCDAQILNETYGPILIGTTFSFVVYAFSLAQAVQYFRLYRTDTRYVRTIVWSTLLLDLFHTGLIIHACGWRIVEYHSNLIGLAHTDWTFQAFNFVSAVIIIQSQFFYAGRVYRALGPRFQWVTLLAAIGMASSLALTISLTIQSVREPNFLILRKINWTLVWVCGSAMITDITLTSALVIKLMRSRTGWKRSDSIIRKIVAYALSSGLLFTLLAATCFLLTLVLTGNLIYIGISNIGVKVYVLSLLTVIKSRKMLATRMMEDTPLPSFPSSPATRPTVGEQSAMEFAPVQVLAVNIHTTSFAVTDPSKPSYLAATASDSTVHAQ